jgi:hypothetical protein
MMACFIYSCIYSFNYSIDQFVHMMENASVWRRRRTPYIHFNLLIAFIYSINQKKFFGEPYLGVVTMATAEEEAGVEAAAEETGSSSGDLESFEMESETTPCKLLFIRSKILATVPT